MGRVSLPARCAALLSIRCEAQLAQLNAAFSLAGRNDADNDSTDEPLSALQPLIDRGIVTYIPWPGLKSAAQSKQLKDCFSTTRAEETQWMAGIDIGAHARTTFRLHLMVGFAFVLTSACALQMSSSLWCRRS